MLKYFYSTSLVVFSVLFAPQAEGQTINTDENGNVISIHHLQIGDKLFNVNFLVTTFADYYGSVPAPNPVPYFWFDPDGAALASKTINDTLNASGFNHTPVTSVGAFLYVVPWHPTSVPTEWFLVLQSNDIPPNIYDPNWHWVALGYDGVHVTETIPLATFEEVQDPVVLLEDLRILYGNLGLPFGTDKGLSVKLLTAIRVLKDQDTSNDVVACNVTGAFINAVKAQAGKKIPQEAADALISEAMFILQLLECQ